MPARVEFRHGSIFDEACDLLVIPSSAGGTVTPGVQKDIRNARLPFPGAMAWGTISVYECLSPLYGAVAYAAAVSGQTSSAEIVEKIGRELGKVAAARKLTRIAAPALGAGAGDLPPNIAVAALTRGFVETAPKSAVLVINILASNMFIALTSTTGANPLSAAATRALVKRLWKSLPAQSARPVPPQKPRVTRRPGAAAALPQPAAAPPVRKRQPAPAPAPPAARPEPAPAPPVRKRQPAPAPAPPAARPEPISAPSVRNSVFVSYSHADVDWLKRLQKHLRPLERAGIDVWDDTRLEPGAPWREEIRQALAETKVAILLISADFLASDFIVTDELPPLLKAAEEDGATILPVIVSPCRFGRTPSLSRFQSVNDPEKPLLDMGRANRERVLDKVARAVEDALKPSPG